jgi:YesN/AraC family two-component response regulator
MRLAKQMLDESMLIYQVCEKIGFENSSYFAKIFKRFHGVSPTEYKSKGRRN